MAQQIGVVLVFVATGNLVHALAHERFQRVGAVSGTAFREMAGHSGTQVKGVIRSMQPRQTAVRREGGGVKGGDERQGQGGLERMGECGRISHTGSLHERMSLSNPTLTGSAPCLQLLI